MAPIVDRQTQPLHQIIWSSIFLMGTVERPLVHQSISVITTQPIVEIALTYAYCQQVGHEFKNCLFVDDKLKRLMRKKFKTSLQLVVLITPMTHVGVPIQQIQTQPNLVITNPIPITQHFGWTQPVKPLIVRQPQTIPYLMWYNIIPSFVPMDLNMYSMYYS